MFHKFRTSCPRNCYSTCSLIVTVEDGRICKVEGDPLHLPARQPCLKGRSYIEEVYSKERLMYPLRRKGERGAGEWERISWDEALTEIVSHLTQIKEESGPEAVFYYTGSGSSGVLPELALAFWYQYGGYTTTYGSLCWSAGIEATRLVYGTTAHADPEDLLNSKLIVLWGKNPSYTNMQEATWILDALEKDAKLVVIDPFKQPLAEVADLFLQPKPGTDGMLALAVINQLIGGNYIDHSFIANNCMGFAELALGVQQYTLTKAVCETGLSVEQIQAFVELIGTIKPMRIISGYGIQRYTNGGETIRAMAMIPAITGNIGVAGGGWNYANTQADLELTLPLPRKPERIRRSIPVAQISKGLQETNNPSIRMAWIERANPLVSNPDVNKLKASLHQLEFIVVNDLFMTDTALSADIVLPAKSLFEETDIITSYWHNYILIRDKVIEPYAESRAETWIYRELLKKMSYDPSWIPEDTESLLDSLLKKKGLSLAKMRKHPVYAPWASSVPYSDCKFATPSGKIELASDLAVKRWGLTRTPQYRPPIETVGTDLRYSLHLITIHSKGRIHSQFRHNRWLEELHQGPTLKMNIDDAITRNLQNGDMIIIYNDRGQMHARVEITWGIQSGIVIIEEGWWQDEGGSVDLLTAERITDMGFGTAFHDCLVEVKRYE